MALLVHKYGGTSVGSIERIQAVAARIIRDKQQGHDVIVVVSAIAGETDRLIRMAVALQLVPTSKEYAALVTTGEQVTATLLAMALMQNGYAACSYSGSKIPLITNDKYEAAEIETIDTKPLLTDIRNQIIPIVAGFQGITKDGNMTTLGRGGSDMTAVVIAAALQAQECRIYTDVDGVYSDDPRFNPQAIKLNCISIETMIEMAARGAKVLQLRAAQAASQHHVSLRILSSFNENEGTIITYNNVIKTRMVAAK